ncbi:hypothetical protein AVEN_214919-1 [Araneus ventricosus]|uniref:Uncharacterized protein n=1 Tax=Araneus ventricosus TaxID=182803 RepID=A0A4Y2D8U6_ARAVE|nr:hypothetical protein AVEN_214919-1 [Araneus ventricosus]
MPCLPLKPRSPQRPALPMSIVLCYCSGRNARSVQKRARLPNAKTRAESISAACAEIQYFCNSLLTHYSSPSIWHLLFQVVKGDGVVAVELQRDLSSQQMLLVAWCLTCVLPEGLWKDEPQREGIMRIRAEFSVVRNAPF